MAKPQQTELARSGLGATDPASAKTHVQVEPKGKGGAGSLAPVPEDNRPGHHPEHVPDKPIAQYVARARELSEEAHRDVAEEPTTAVADAVGPAAARRRPGVGDAVVATVSAIAFLDAARRPDATWARAGERKLPWLAAIALLPGVGTMAYAVRVRPRLEGATG